MEDHGYEVKDDCLAELSPYQTEHINHFGHYSLNFNRTPEAAPLDFRKPPQSEKTAPARLLMMLLARIGSSEH